MVLSTIEGKNRLQFDEQRLGEIPQSIAVRVVLSRIENLHGHRGTTRGLSVAAPAGDRQLPDKVLQLALSENVIPESHLFNQFTSAVAQTGNSHHLVVRGQNVQYLGLRLDLGPASGRKANLWRVP